MSTRCRPHRAPAGAPGLDRGHLAVVLDGLLSACAQPLDPAESDPPLAVSIVGADPATAEIHLWGLDGPDPVRELFGLTAPAAWTAFGVVATGRVRRVHTSVSGRVAALGPGTGGEPEPEGRSGPGPHPGDRVMVATLVSRRGDQLTAARVGPGQAVSPVDPGSTGDDRSAGGRIPDACRRVLGLATAPAGSPIVELWATRWLERLLASAAADPRSWSWAEVVACFPSCAGPGDAHDAGDAATATRRLADAAESVSLWSWADLRRVHAGGPVAALGIEPGHAAWMDDGMFSREVLGGLPLAEELLADLDELLAPSVTAQIRRALLGWGLA